MVHANWSSSSAIVPRCAWLNIRWMNGRSVSVLVNSLACFFLAPFSLHGLRWHGYTVRIVGPMRNCIVRNGLEDPF